MFLELSDGVACQKPHRTNQSESDFLKMKMLLKKINAQLRFDLEKEFSRISNHFTDRFVSFENKQLMQ